MHEFLERHLTPVRKLLFFHAVSFFAIRGFPVIASLLTAHILGASEFGIFIFAISLFSSALLFVDVGLSLATTTLIARRSGDDQGFVTLLVSLIVCLGLGALVSVATLTQGAAIAGALGHSGKLQSAITAGALYIPSAALAFVFQGGFAGRQQYRDSAIFAVGGGLIFVVAVLAFALTGDGAMATWGAAIGMLCRTAVVAVALSPALLKALRRIERSSFVAELRLLASIALPAVLASLAFSPVISYMFATLMRNPGGTAEAGGFGAALQIFGIVSVAPSIVTQFALPRLSAIGGEDPRAARMKLVRKYALSSLVVASAFALPVALFPKAILTLMGPDFRPFFQCLQVMMIAAVLSAPQGVFSNYLLASDKGWWRMITFYCWAGATLGSLLILGDYSALSAAASYAAGWGALTFLQATIVLAHSRSAGRRRQVT